MHTIKGPGICLTQFLRDKPPYNNLGNISDWAGNLGYKGVQIPSWDSRVIDLDKASESKTYCDEIKGLLSGKGIEITELVAHLQGQVLAIHPVYAEMFQPFYPAGLNDRERTVWATGQLKKAIKASASLGTKCLPVLSGGFAWQMVYPWPQRPDGIIEEAMLELAKRWLPVLNFASGHGITIGFELHPGSDLFDGLTFEMFLQNVNNNPSACLNYDPSHFLLQQLDYLQFIEIYHDRIKGFHVKDAEFRPDGRVGMYGGYQPWINRAGRFRSLGDGQIDFKRIFSLLTQYGYESWAVLEWECCIKSPEQGAREGTLFIKDQIIDATEVAFDDFTKSEANRTRNRQILGLNENL